MNDDIEQDGPTEGDLVTYDHRNLFVWGGGSRKSVLLVSDVNRFNAQVRAFMKKDNFFPNVWFISDHGNAHLIDVTKRD